MSLKIRIQLFLGGSLVSFLIFLLLQVFMVDQVNLFLKRDIELGIDPYFVINFLLSLFFIIIFASIIVGFRLTAIKTPTVIRTNGLALLTTFIWLTGIAIIFLTSKLKIDFTFEILLITQSLFLAYVLKNTAIYFVLFLLIFVIWQQVYYSIDEKYLEVR